VKKEPGKISGKTDHLIREDVVSKWLMLLLIVLMVPLPAFAGVPLDTVKAHVNGVIEVLSDPKLQGESGEKEKARRVEAAAEKLFDFVELSKRSLGMHWNTFTHEQRKEFVELFKAFLKDTYVHKITAYANLQVNFTKEVSLSDTTVEVQSDVVTESSPIPVYSRVIRRDNEWKVYDVVVEGVSLVENYRTQFREILANNPPEKLLETLRKKVAKGRGIGRDAIRPVPVVLM
jgi:phospholipid transport system substrate-binding protein